MASTPVPPPGLWPRRARFGRLGRVAIKGERPSPTRALLRRRALCPSRRPEHRMPPPMSAPSVAAALYASVDAQPEQATPPGASPCQAGPPQPLPSAGGSPERCRPWEPEPAA
jgi:hypothetical protein